MKILMLGWEYPPHIAGGLGTACQGLTSAISERGVLIHFVVPHLFGDEAASHMVISDYGSRPKSGEIFDFERSQGEGRAGSPEPQTTSRVAAFLSPYWSAERFQEAIAALSNPRKPGSAQGIKAEPLVRALIEGEVYGVDVDTALRPQSSVEVRERAALYPSGKTIFEEVERFTGRVVSHLAQGDFDIIHAHDWMTFPAGVALAQLTGKPLIVHVHSLEQDRSGQNIDKDIEKIERLGLQSATRVVAVSHYTRRSIERYHGVPSAVIDVVHNGIYPRQAIQGYRIKRTWPRHVVLFLGRVTFQKGPDYFVEVATRVVPQLPEVLFVLAGTGDMIPALQSRVEQLGLAHNFLFPGFLSAEEVEEMFSIADLYLMPSVSEPFGLSALEAINFDVPVIISKQSGVAEVLENALKVDFWDLPRMAELIIQMLTDDEMRKQLVVGAKQEIQQLHWSAAADKTIEIYRKLMQVEDLPSRKLEAPFLGGA